MSVQLIKPIITEKTSNLAQAGQYTFLVSLSATKPSIKQAITRMFNVNVTKIRLIKRSGKIRRFGKKKLPSRQSSFQKAIISIKPGETIKYFELPDKKTKKKSSTKPVKKT